MFCYDISCGIKVSPILLLFIKQVLLLVISVYQFIVYKVMKYISIPVENFTEKWKHCVQGMMKHCQYCEFYQKYFDDILELPPFVSLPLWVYQKKINFYDIKVEHPNIWLIFNWKESIFVLLNWRYVPFSWSKC